MFDRFVVVFQAKRSEEAFQIAVGHREMNKFAIALGDGGTMDDCNLLVMYSSRMYLTRKHFFRFEDSQLL